MKIVLSPSSSERFEGDETDGFYLIASGIADGAILLENIRKDPRVDYFDPSVSSPSNRSLLEGERTIFMERFLA